MVTSLQDEVNRYKQELEQAIINQDAAMRDKQKEKYILHGQIDQCMKQRNNLEDENRRCRVELECVRRENDCVMAEY